MFIFSAGIVTVLPGVKEKGVPFPKPGSLSKKYSAPTRLPADGVNGVM